MDAAIMLSVIESEMLDNLVSQLLKGRHSDAYWQLNKIQQLDELRGANLRTIAEKRGDLIKAVRAEIEKEVLKRAKMVDDITAGAGKSLAQVMKPKADKGLTSIVDMWERTAARKFGEAFAPMLKKADTIYTDTIYKAVAKEQMGTSHRQAIAEACSEWSQQGLKALTDSAGRQWTTEAYAQTVIRSNITQAATETQIYRMAELGEDLVEISSHLGARPKCALYQGQIFSLSGRSGKYPSLASTSYGEPDGLFGINCRHVMYPYIEGTEQTYTRQEEKENEQVYKESQKQREKERQIRGMQKQLEARIRESKRDLSIMERIKSDKDIERAKNLLSKRQESMRDFISKTGRTRRPEREKVY